MASGPHAEVAHGLFAQQPSHKRSRSNDEGGGVDRRNGGASCHQIVLPQREHQVRPEAIDWLDGERREAKVHEGGAEGDRPIDVLNVELPRWKAARHLTEAMVGLEVGTKHKNAHLQSGWLLTVADGRRTGTPARSLRSVGCRAAEL